MRRGALLLAVLLVLGAWVPAPAAEITPDHFSGIWKFDPQRTRDQLGYASVPPGSPITGLLDINIPEHYVAFCIGEGDYCKISLYAAEVMGRLLILHGKDGDTLTLGILDADSLLLQKGRINAVFVRAPKPRH